jgi:hypothetical protein
MWTMKKIYHTPVLRSQRLELGLFGDYGQGGGGGEGGGNGGEVVVPTPIKVVDFFELNME